MDNTPVKNTNDIEVPLPIPSSEVEPESGDLSNQVERSAKAKTDKIALQTEIKAKSKEWLTKTISDHDKDLQNRKTRERETNQISTTDYKTLSQEDIKKLTLNYLENLKESTPKTEKKHALGNLISKLNK